MVDDEPKVRAPEVALTPKLPRNRNGAFAYQKANHLGERMLGQRDSSRREIISRRRARVGVHRYERHPLR
jgi:hypothetical protein